MKNKSTAIWCIIWAISLCSFCLIFLTGDFQCFISWARQVSESDLSGIAALSDTWELKGILSRALYLLFYNIASLSGISDISLQFHYLYKFIGAVLLNGFLLLSIAIFPKKYLSQGVSKTRLFFIGSTLLMCVHFASHLQPEFIAVYFCILSFALYLRDNVLSKILSGVLLGFTFFLKSPIPLMGGSIFCLAMLLKRTKFKKEFISILPMGVAMLLTIAIALVSLHFYSPQEIQDILDASSFQHSLFSTPEGTFAALRNGVYSFFVNIWYSPIIGFGICVIIKTLCDIRKERIPIILLLCCSFLIPLIYVVISNCFFVYHYYLFAFPAVVAILYYHGCENLSFSKSEFIIVITAIAFALIVNAWAYHLPSSPKYLVCWSILLFGSIIVLQRKYKEIPVVLLICSLIFVYITNSSAISASAIRAESLYQKNISKERFDGFIAGEPLPGDKILFLEDGCAGYLVTNRSYLRYFYPLPIQRTDEHNSDFVNSITFKTVKKMIEDFDGDYILVDRNWFFNFEHLWVSRFMNNYYKLIGNIECYNPSWELFRKIQLDTTTIEVYKKIEQCIPK